MANISLYISGQTELEDLSEFFQKRLIGEGETPIAFFDGVFYESHQERVGNIVYQDYLIYTDKALYLWARGASKDFLDRFSLGAVSVNSRNKDSAFATVNLKIRREGKEPIYVIFDMVEIREADTIVKLQTLIESIIEDYLGINYRQEIPQDTAGRIFQAARTICPPRQLVLQLDTPQAPTPDAGIGYGQDLLEQYRASAGYEQPQMPYPPYQPPVTGGARPRSMGPQDAMRGLESMLPTDPASLKRIAEQIKNMVGDAPFKMRDQVMKDLQHVPGDMATVLTALNELLSNIAGNPMAERFVMNAIKTAVANDGVLGSLSKIIKMTGFGSGGGKKSSRPPAHEPAQEERSVSKERKSPFVEEDPDEDGSTIRRKKISIKDDDNHAGADLFAGNDEPITSRESRPPVSRSSVPDDSDSGAESGGRRKKLSIKMEDDNEIARKLMSYDESERDVPSPAPVEASPAVSTENGSGIRRKKLVIKAEEGGGAEADIARKLMGYDEASRGAVKSALSGEVPGSVSSKEQSEPEPLRRKKIQIKADVEPEQESELVVEAEPEESIRKKIQIKTETESELLAPLDPDVEIEPESEPTPVVSLELEVDLEPEELAVLEPEMEFEPESEPEPEVPVKKKIQIKAEPEPELEVSPELEIESMLEPEPQLEVPAQKTTQIEAELEEEIDISEEVIFSALGEIEEVEGSGVSQEYMTIESDIPVRRVVSEPIKEPASEPVIEKKPEQPRHSSGKASRGKRRGR
ncbi:hypothetical protein NY406_09010 [Chlorobaculum sp. MV4-Y]|uniref:hypothetical protein n=1 Tax=Chlorobaculum sp. MV4-Y TaxID=2976335 RepID=UPI0021AEF54F|nr:hypothetical protein [Chlorobaculum sp. MV4-Y]UWX57338.1 hypothetical protein NY406_09010 [Chlorobaculum sp. MV4-Y]